MNKSAQEGYAHLILVLVVAAFVGVLISANLPITRTYFDGRSTLISNPLVLGDSSTPTNKGIQVISDSGVTAFYSGNVGAISNYPFKILNSNSLSVDTPDGTKLVTVLPGQAIINLVEGRILTEVTSIPATGSLASINKLVSLEDENGILGYKITGERTNFLLGSIPVKTKVSAFVSAENGQVVSSDTSLLGRALNKSL